MEPAHISKESLFSRKDDLDNLLRRRFYIMQSFAIYGGKAGLYDYGPPGCAIKANVEKLWREHFVIEDDMFEISCTNITPEIVLRASGHEEKFTDFMVKDVERPDLCYRADHLILQFIEKEKETKKNTLSAEKAERYEEIILRINEFSAEEIDAVIKELNIKSPTTHNALSPSYPFNLMFAVQIGPTGDSKGYLRPETAQGIFVNFRNLLEYNGGRVPFACAQFGIGFRNEIAPRGGLLRLREFGMAEIEHFVDPEDKSHSKFAKYKDYKIPLYHRKLQKPGVKGEAEKLSLGEALEEKIIDNETLAYFIARTHLFLTRCGACPEGIRFRQHTEKEMAHYSQDCWDAEILTSYGWIEVVGIADRSAYDLTRHAQFSKKDLVAARKYAQPKEVTFTEVKLKKDLIGQTFPGEGKNIIDYLESLDDCAKDTIKEVLEKNKSYQLIFDENKAPITLTPEMIPFEKKKKMVREEKFVPHVIEPSFGIGRIIYCCWEHCFKMRSKERTYLHLPPKIAPYKCSILTVVLDPQFDPFVERIVSGLKKLGVSNKVDVSGQGIGKRYARTDELGIPFGVTIDYDALVDNTVPLREISTTLQVRVPIDEINQLIYNLSEETVQWEEVLQKYPLFTSASKD